MSDPEQPKPKQNQPQPRAQTEPPVVKKVDGKLPSLEDRRLAFTDLAPHAGLLDSKALIAMLHDGRAIVRANGALGMAAIGNASPDLVPLIRDSELVVGLAVADALERLGDKIRPIIPQIVQALSSAQPDVLDLVVAVLSKQIGGGDEELAAALDVPDEIAMKTVVAAAKLVGGAGIKFLIKAAATDRIRIRVNAIGGLARLGKTDIATSMAFLTEVEANDPVPDVRTAAKLAMLAVIAREKVVAVDHLPKNIPDFEERKLSASELRESEAHIKIDEMIHALQDGRAHVKINAVRALALKGSAGAAAAGAMGVNLKDSIAAVRKETAKALGKLGGGAIDAAKDLVHALGDADEEVAEAASETLEGLGDAATDALVAGLDAGTEIHGLRVGAVLVKLGKAQALLTETFKSPAVNVQVNSALALMQLGPKVSGAALAALHGARTGGDGRTRDAVRRALDQIESKQDTGPKTVSLEGFEDRFLDAKDIDKAKPELERVGVADLATYLMDGRDVVRANAALALAAIGPAALGTASTLGVRLRDDAPRVRLAAAQALERLGDAAVVETASQLVGALRDADDKVAETCGATLRARKGKVVGALVRGLETDDPRHGRRICEVILALPDAVDILCDAFESPAVNVQVNAALGLAMLGKDKVGKGRKALESARTGGDARTRDAVRAAIETLDGPRDTGRKPVAVEGFETRYLEASAFGDAGKLRLDELIHYLQDGRGIVRANAATAIGVIGPAAAGAATAVGVLCRDDDNKVRIAAAQTVDKLGDEAVKETAAYLISALRGDPDVAKVVAGVLVARKARLLTALLKGLETDDETQGRRILDVINALPDACEILCDAFDSPAENVQVNAAMGIGMLGAKRAGKDGQKKLEGARTGGFARTREAVFKALAVLKG